MVLEGEDLETVGEVCFLGSVVRSTEIDFSRRIILASTAFSRF